MLAPVVALFPASTETAARRATAIRHWVCAADSLAAVARALRAARATRGCCRSRPLAGADPVQRRRGARQLDPPAGGRARGARRTRRGHRRTRRPAPGDGSALRLRGRHPGRDLVVLLPLLAPAAGILPAGPERRRRALLCAAAAGLVLAGLVLQRRAATGRTALTAEHSGIVVLGTSGRAPSSTAGTIRCPTSRPTIRSCSTTAIASRGSECGWRGTLPPSGRAFTPSASRRRRRVCCAPRLRSLWFGVSASRKSSPRRRGRPAPDCSARPGARWRSSSRFSRVCCGHSVRCLAPATPGGVVVDGRPGAQERDPCGGRRPGTESAAGLRVADPDRRAGGGELDRSPQARGLALAAVVALALVAGAPALIDRVQSLAPSPIRVDAPQPDG